MQFAIDHMRLADIRPQHLSLLYKKLAQLGIRGGFTEKAYTSVDFKESKEGQQVMCRAMEEMRNESILAERKHTAIRLIKVGKLFNEEIAVGVIFILEEVQELTEEISEVVMV